LWPSWYRPVFCVVVVVVVVVVAVAAVVVVVDSVVPVVVFSVVVCGNMFTVSVKTFINVNTSVSQRVHSQVLVRESIHKFSLSVHSQVFHDEHHFFGLLRRHGVPLVHQFLKLLGVEPSRRHRRRRDRQ